MKIILRSIYAAFGTLCFCGIFNVDKKDYIYCALTSAIGFLAYLLSIEYLGVSTTWANMPGVLMVGFFSEIFARLNKRPVTVYAIPGVIPFVPGYGIYETMIYVMQGDYQKSLVQGLNTLIIAWIIAVALIIVSSIFRLKVINPIKIKEKNNS